MGLAWISVAALTLAVILSCTTVINIGVLAISLALIVGVFIGGMPVHDVIAGLPTNLLFTLISVTLLFSIAQCNGTLSRLTERAVKVCRGSAAMLPAMFFLVGFLISTIGAGATPASALLAPPAMAAATRMRVPPLLMAVMVGNGVLAGTMSPFSPTGIVADGVMSNIGLGGYEWYTFAFNALAHTFVGVAGFFLFGGIKLLKQSPGFEEEFLGESVAHAKPMDRDNWLTAAGILVLVVSVVAFSLNVAVVAIIVATTLILLKTVDESQAIKRMPWAVILMVTGVTVLINLLNHTQGLDLISTGISNISTPKTVQPIVAFVAGLISVYSSTSGVVLPAFLPMVPKLAHQLGDINPLHIAWSMAVNASLVDMSSLSTVGALFMAGAAEGTDMRKLFNQLLAWGLSMSVVGAILAWIFFS